MSFKTTTLLLITLFFATVLAAEDKLPGAMLSTGSWHGDEVQARDGETWLALIETDDGFALRKATISIEVVVDEILDEPGAKTGKKVFVKDNLEPVVLLSQLEQLQPGPVAGAEIIDRDLSAGQPAGIYFNGMLYELEIACAGTLQGQEVAECPLLLQGEGAQQELMVYPVSRPGTSQQGIASEGSPRILWAGDMDGDNRLDLVIDLTDHYNVSKPTLLLSGEAEDGQLVKPVAVFRTTGC